MPKVGDKVWIFDGNHRVYRKTEEGRTYGPPIYREHWRPAFIVGETRVSWLIGRTKDWPKDIATKVPKRLPTPNNVCFTDAEVDDVCWDHENRHRIADAVGRSYKVSRETLRKIAELIGYDEARS